MSEALWAARYDGAVPAVGLTSAAIEGMLAHRSTRAFRGDALPAGTAETLVAAAQSAPTSSNLQTWSVVAVEDAARRGRIAALVGQPFITQAPLLLVWLADLSRLERVGEAAGQPTTALEYLESFLTAAIDAALAAQNAVVALESLGLGGCYLGVLRNRPLELAAELALPPNVVAVFGLSVGWPDPAVATEVKPRLPQATILHREQYSAAAEPAAVARYDAAMRGFSQRQGLGDQAWTPRALGRVGEAKALNGRDQLAEWLRARGFGMR